MYYVVQLSNAIFPFQSSWAYVCSFVSVSHCIAHNFLPSFSSHLDTQIFQGAGWSIQVTSEHHGN